MLKLKQYIGQPIDVAASKIYKSEASVLEKADAFCKINIDVLDQDTRVYTARILNEADASGVKNESIDLLRAAFQAELARGGYKPNKKPRKAEDMPIIDPPIWASLDDDDIE